MKLKDYISSQLFVDASGITEAISSGKFRSKDLTDDRFASILNWLINCGCEITNDFGYTTKKHRDKPAVFGDYDKGYDASVIKLFIPYDGNEYWFELLFDKNTEKLIEIFAYKGLYSIMNNESLTKKLSFIEKCLA